MLLLSFTSQYAERYGIDAGRPPDVRRAAETLADQGLAHDGEAAVGRGDATVIVDADTAGGSRCCPTSGRRR
ncbi:hypothetical protein [Streptomyces sp. NRRL F-2664]|uniref:hypothetical protein n=1 Tax=Streptomyces sp. NRRL F-2664 TaxID=1463842 RepID=UPI00131AB868|nr:hypothetical protein [Streptomyces sp. NRRL F-2664]